MHRGFLFDTALRHSSSTQLFDTSLRHIPSTHPLDTTPRHNPSTQPLDTASSTQHFDTALRHISSTHLFDKAPCLTAVRRPAVETAGLKDAKPACAGSRWARHGSTAPRARCGASHKPVALAFRPVDCGLDRPCFTEGRRVTRYRFSNGAGLRAGLASFKPAVSTAGRRSAGKRCVEEKGKAQHGGWRMPPRL